MRRLLIIISVVSVAAGCLPDGERELPFPTFEAEAPFPELSGETEAVEDPAEESTDDPTEGFEEALAELEDEEPAEPADTPTVPSNVQQVPLAGRLIAEVPADFDRWTWSTDGKATLLVYRRGIGSRAEALVYVESFGGMIKASPSSEFRRFYQTVDPNLTTPLSLQGVSSRVMQNVSQEMNVDRSAVEDAIRRATSRTLGKGLNYRSTDGTFTGWKWIGRNDAEVEFRLGRSDGTWTSQADIGADVMRVIDGFSQQTQAMQGLRQRMVGEQAGAVDPNRSPAWMLVGSALTTKSNGVHVAILCRTTSGCPVSEELSDFLATMKPASAGEIERIVGAASMVPLPALAEEQGVTLVPENELLQPQQILQQLQQGGAGSIPIEGLEGLPLDLPIEGLPTEGGPGGQGLELDKDEALRQLNEL